jgi:hypothetical protein
MQIDSTGHVGFSRKGAVIYIHLPKRDKPTPPNTIGPIIRDAEGAIIFNNGSQLELPKEYFTNPPNEITRERCELIENLPDSTPLEKVEKVCPMCGK